MAFNLSQHISKNLHERADHSNRLMKFIPCLKLKIHQVSKKTTIESILDYHSTLAASTLFQLYVNMLNFLINKHFFQRTEFCEGKEITFWNVHKHEIFKIN